jgi:hypothetical protein
MQDAGCRREHLLELLAITPFPAGPVRVFENHRPASSGSKGPKLVFGVLSSPSRLLAIPATALAFRLL